MRDTTRQLHSLYKKFNGLCFYCEENLEFRDSTRDHFWPRSRAGWNGIKNLVLCCHACNNAKADRLPTLAEYYKFLTIRPDTTIDNLHEPPLEQLPVHYQEAFRQRNARRAAKAAIADSKNQSHKNRAEARRTTLFYSNLAGPTYFGAGDEGRVIRAHREEAFPFTPIKYLTV